MDDNNQVAETETGVKAITKEVVDDALDILESFADDKGAIIKTVILSCVSAIRVSLRVPDDYNGDED